MNKVSTTLRVTINNKQLAYGAARVATRLSLEESVRFKSEVGCNINIYYIMRIFRTFREITFDNYQAALIELYELGDSIGDAPTKLLNDKMNIEYERLKRLIKKFRKENKLMNDIIYCPDCGIEVIINNSGDTICPKCGTNITQSISK